MRVRLSDVLRGALARTSELPAVLRGAWLSARPAGAAPRSIGWFLERNARRHPDRPALYFEGSSISHAELDRRVNQRAHALVGLGVAHGEAVGVMATNSPELLVTVGALAKLGAVAAMLNHHQRGAVLAHSFRVSRARRVIVDDELHGAMAEVEVPELIRGSELAEESRGQSSERLLSLDRVQLSEPCFYIYTSGTTGLPKASIMSHHRWMKAGGVFGQVLLALGPKDVVYAPLPFYHNQALTVAWASAATSGAALAMARRFSASRFWDDCREHRATSFVYIGEIPRYLLAQPPSGADRDHGVTRMTGGGMAADLWGPFRSRFGIDRIHEVYSSSEGNTVFLNAFGVAESIGFCPSRYALVRYDGDRQEIVRDAAGRVIEVADGEAGLLLGKVSERFPYDGYTDPKASEKKLVRDAFEAGDAWVDSGDLLMRVGWGHAVFVDRVGDTFRWKSENVSTTEVEAVLSGIPGVRECAVYGVLVPDHPGRAGMAAIVAAPDLDLGVLHARAAEALPSYAVPVFLRFVDSLETTGTFKHQKSALREAGYRVDGALVRGPEGYRPLDPEALEAGAFRL